MGWGATVRRSVIAPVLALLGGAIVTVAIAWGIAGTAAPRLRLDLDFRSRDREAYASGLVEAGRTVIRTAPTIRLVDDSSMMIASRQPAWCTEPFEESDDVVRLTLAHGWPVRTMKHRETIGDAFRAPNDGLDGGVAIKLVPGDGSTDGHQPALPLVIIVAPFVASSIGWACVLIGAVLLVQALRDARRHRRVDAGRCQECGHDVTAAQSPRCPECGAAVLGPPPVIRAPSIRALAWFDVAALTVVGVVATVLVLRTETPSPLHLAALRGDLEGVEERLALGDDVNLRLHPMAAYTDVELTSPLVWASAGGDLRVVDRLLDAGADPAAITVRGMDALEAAVRRDHPAVIARLLDAGADVNRPQAMNRATVAMPSALHAAAAWASPDTVRLLIDRGAAVNPGYPISPVEMAVAHGRPDIVRVLLDAGGTFDERRLADPYLLDMDLARANERRLRALLECARSAGLTRTIERIEARLEEQ